VQRTIYVLRRSAEGLRSAINDLHLEEERDRPFPALVTFVVQRSRARAWGCEITLEVREGFPSAPFGETGTHLSPTIQEMITNARSHSGAKGIAVTLQTRGSDLLAEVLDDGHGLGPETPSGVGLSSMRKRGAIVGGKLVIESQFGQGTRVRLRAPEP
jgi:signal transduction histidine kinase